MYRLMLSMQDVADRPQLGGVISRRVVFSRLSTFAEGRMATSSPLLPVGQRKRNPRKCTSSGLRTPLFSSLTWSRIRFSRKLRIDLMTAGPFTAHEDIRI